MEEALRRAPSEGRPFCRGPCLDGFFTKSFLDYTRTPFCKGLFIGGFLQRALLGWFLYKELLRLYKDPILQRALYWGLFAEGPAWMVSLQRAS